MLRMVRGRRLNTRAESSRRDGWWTLELSGAGGTQARHTLSYVLSNWRKHGEDRREVTRGWKLDWFSSAAMFPDWAEYKQDEYALWSGPPTYEPLFVYRPRTWLLREGWKKVGTISTREVPSAKR